MVIDEKARGGLSRRKGWRPHFGQRSGGAEIAICFDSAGDNAILNGDDPGAEGCRARESGVSGHGTTRLSITASTNIAGNRFASCGGPSTRRNCCMADPVFRAIPRRLNVDPICAGGVRCLGYRAESDLDHGVSSEFSAYVRYGASKIVARLPGFGNS